MKLRTTTAMLAAAILLGACSGTPTEEPQATSAPDAPADDAPADDAPADDTDAPVEPVSTDEVDVAMFRFKPEVIAVEVGTTVTFVNGDNTEHTVTAGTEDAPDPDRFDLPVDVIGDEVTVTFDEAGTYEYYCVIHPFMVGTVVVG